MSGGERPSKSIWAGPYLPPSRLQYQTVDVQQRQILRPARTDGRTPYSWQEDRVTERREPRPRATAGPVV